MANRSEFLKIDKIVYNLHYPAKIFGLFIYLIYVIY